MVLFADKVDNHQVGGSLGIIHSDNGEKGSVVVLRHSTETFHRRQMVLS